MKDRNHLSIICFLHTCEAENDNCYICSSELCASFCTNDIFSEDLYHVTYVSLLLLVVKQALNSWQKSVFSLALLCCNVMREEEARWLSNAISHTQIIQITLLPISDALKSANQYKYQHRKSFCGTFFYLSFEQNFKPVTLRQFILF